MTRPSGVRLEHHGCSLFALDRGDGPAILFFHGGLADHRAALLHVGQLTDRLRVITPDLRGSGRSHWHGRLSWEAWADDAVAWLDHLGLDRAVVGGVSLGAAVALRTAVQHPDRLVGLVLVHPAHSADDGFWGPQQVALDAMRAAGSRVIRQGIGALHPLFSPLPEDIRARAIAMVDSFDPESVAATTAFLGAGTQPVARLADLEVVTCPAWVVPGLDESHPEQVARDVVEHLPNASLEEPGDALPDRLAEQVRAWS